MGGTLYATDIYDESTFKFTFGSIDLATGFYTVINDQGGSANWHGLAGNDSAGILYTIDLDDGGKLKSVTPTGAITTIGSTDPWVDGRGMAYDNINQILYATGNSNLYTIDTTTAAASLIGSMGIDDDYFGLAYDPINDILFGNSGNTNNLYSIDVTSGLATLIGPNGVSSIDGLAFIPSPVPEPSTFLLLGGGLAGLAFVVRRRKKA
jgi:hypothetical protein